MVQIIENPVWEDIARAIFNKLDAPRKKSEPPIKPIIAEINGLAKAGKDTVITEVERWFKLLKFNVLVTQESAETQEIRSMSRVHPYAFEIRHMAYSLSNLLSAASSRNFHCVFQNRGVLDNLAWLEWNRRQGNFSDNDVKHAKNFILNGPWISYFDAIIYLVCDPETSLYREYGSYPPKRYGSRMNPKSLALMKNCIEDSIEELKISIPYLPVLIIDTSNSIGKTIAEEKDEIVHFILNSAKKRLELCTEDLAPWSTTILRDMAKIMSPEIKLKGLTKYKTLIENGWIALGAFQENDTYLSPANTAPLENDECLHIRECSGRYYIILKRGENCSRSRTKISIPITKELAESLTSSFIVIAHISKERELFKKDGYLLSCDRVLGLGDFTEIKGSTPDSYAELLTIAKSLGFGEADVIPQTYLRQLLARQSSV
ncbi:MAG: CYTH domain-containing protein [Parcubacteria group bacterium]|nr:CYTH domain-containing protein [Parcubacteria group bacterium]